MPFFLLLPEICQTTHKHTIKWHHHSKVYFLISTNVHTNKVKLGWTKHRTGGCLRFGLNQCLKSWGHLVSWHVVHWNTFLLPKICTKTNKQQHIIRSLAVMELEGWFCRFQAGHWSHDWNTTATKTASASEVHCSLGPRRSGKLGCADSPYLAQIRAWTPEHSLIRIGKSGLDFFRFTYCCSTKSLHNRSNTR